MSDFFGRRGAAYINELKRSCGALVGIATGMLADGHLNDEEIRFLDRWLIENDAVASEYPGDILHARIRAVLADRVVTEEERAHLAQTIQKIIGGRLEQLAADSHVSELALDDVPRVDFAGARFCFSGDFAYAPRPICIEHTEARGGLIVSNVTKSLRYLVVGGLGSAEWKHGSFGTKVEKAIQYRRDGLPIVIVHEDRWASSLMHAI